MKLIDGATYRTRDGNSYYKVFFDVRLACAGDAGFPYRAEGTGLSWNHDGSQYSDGPSNLDLVERVLITPFEEK
jgi:hypothetical protein